MPLQGNDCLRLADLKTTLSVKFTMPRKTEKKMFKIPRQEAYGSLIFKENNKKQKKTLQSATEM